MTVNGVSFIVLLVLLGIATFIALRYRGRAQYAEWQSTTYLRRMQEMDAAQLNEWPLNDWEVVSLSEAEQHFLNPLVIYPNPATMSLQTEGSKTNMEN